jgi:hypothetical protein
VLAKSPGAGQEEMQLPIPGKKGEGDGSGQVCCSKAGRDDILVILSD